MSGIESLTKAESPWIDHNVARAVARLLLSRTTVKDMYIFGSVARVGQGRDLDVVVTPAVPEIADEFIDRVNAVWAEKGYQTADIPKRLPAVRWSEAQAMLPLDRQELLDAQSPTAQQKIDWLDIIILPDNWTSIPNDKLNPGCRTTTPLLLATLQRTRLYLMWEMGFLNRRSTRRSPNYLQ